MGMLRKQWESVIAAIKYLFNGWLSPRLLFFNEFKQTKDLTCIINIFVCVFFLFVHIYTHINTSQKKIAQYPNRPLTSIYGAEHFIRIFCKLPSCFAEGEGLSLRQRQILAKQYTEFAEFTNQFLFFLCVFFLRFFALLLVFGS